MMPNNKDNDNMTGSTPGPWTTPGTDGDARVVCGVNRKHGGRRQTIAHVYSFALPGRANYDAERDANAALIVVAPDMMALRARAVDDRIDNEWMETARAVIAKANDGIERTRPMPKGCGASPRTSPPPCSQFQSTQEDRK